MYREPMEEEAVVDAENPEGITFTGTPLAHFYINSSVPHIRTLI
jgi:hypothetical protein